jgi:hypothetical protein
VLIDAPSHIVCGVRSSAEDVTSVSSSGMITAAASSAALPAMNLNWSSTWMLCAMLAAWWCSAPLLYSALVVASAQVFASKFLMYDCFVLPAVPV